MHRRQNSASEIPVSTPWIPFTNTACHDTMSTRTTRAAATVITTPHRIPAMMTATTTTVPLPPTTLDVNGIDDAYDIDSDSDSDSECGIKGSDNTWEA